MTEQLGDGRLGLAVFGELGPVRDDLLVVVDQAALHAHGNGDRDDALGGAEHDLQRIVVWPVAGLVERPAADVDHPGAAVVHGG